jgi:hypothetical protein
MKTNNKTNKTPLTNIVVKQLSKTNMEKISGGQDKKIDERVPTF